MSWRDFVPFVKNEGKIRLGEAEEERRYAYPDDETATGKHGDDEYIEPECPRLRANIFQRLTFSWMTPMMKTGYRKFLTEEDLWALPVRRLILHPPRHDLGESMLTLSRPCSPTTPLAPSATASRRRGSPAATNSRTRPARRRRSRVKKRRTPLRRPTASRRSIATRRSGPTSPARS